nr:MAG TPA: hypothetical protein [Caudoviricetes sp.]
MEALFYSLKRIFCCYILVLLNIILIFVYWAQTNDSSPHIVLSVYRILDNSSQCTIRGDVFYSTHIFTKYLMK